MRGRRKWGRAVVISERSGGLRKDSTVKKVIQRKGENWWRKIRLLSKLLTRKSVLFFSP